MFPSSSSLNGHPGRPGKRAAGGRGRPGARGPGRGPTVVWAQPGCLGAFSSQAALRSLSEIGSSLTSVSVLTQSEHNQCYCAPPARLLTRRLPPKGRASRAARASPSDRPPRPPRWSERTGPLIKALVSYVLAGRPALAPERHVQPRRRHGCSLRLRRRRQDGENAASLF